MFFTHANDSHMSKVISGVCDSVCLCPHNKTKTAESVNQTWHRNGQSITIPHPPMNIRSKGQRSRSQVKKCKKVIE